MPGKTRLPEPHRLAAAVGLALLGAAPAPDDRCSALTARAPAGVTVTTAVAAPDASGSPACRVEAVARPRPNAAIRFELWLPPSARWSGRYYQMGNGGFAGTIHRPTLAEAAARGDAAAATDTGHRGDGFDARWAAGRPDLVADYAYRSIKVTADAARAIAERYYGKPPQRRYFMGCSNGGRQALVAAARWPSDWDGVLAGAPAARWSNTLANFAVIQHQLRAVPGGWIAPQRLPALIAHARSTCPAGETCRFDPSGQGLSPLQVASLQTVEAAGYPLAAADAAEWARWIVNPDPVAPSQLTFATQAMRHLFAVDRAWTPARHDPRRDRASPPLAGALDVGDLTPFLARGGRILSYFGWADAVLPPAIAVADYRGRAARDSRLRDGYRLFMVPGMAHCQGGAVPHAFGQSLPARALLDDADHDVRRALETWVERGTAPDRLIAADPAGRQAPVALRPL